MNAIGVDALLRRQVTVRAFELAAVDQSLAVLLEPAEQARAGTIMVGTARHDFIAGRVAQRLMAAEMLGAAPQDLVSAYRCPDCGPNPMPSHGRPGYLLNGVPAAISMSFSRSHGWALAAMVPVAGLFLGTDVQHIASVGFAGFDDVALGPAERVRLAAVTPAGRDAWRAAAWARKEALAKLSGLGLRTDPAGIFAFPPPGSAVDVWEVAHGSVGLPDGFAAAVAVNAKAAPGAFLQTARG
ncbi:4'-phosphopantetheinyl transferase family protein [Arthrobacter sp. HLT1-20]